MANTTIPNLPAAISLTGSEQIEVVQSGVSVKTTTGAVAGLNTAAGTVTQINTNSPITGGPITTTGSIGLATGGVDNSYLADMPANTIKGNNFGNVHAPVDLTVAQTMTLLGAAPLNSPTFTGIPQAPTPIVTDDSTQIATTAFVKLQSYGTGSVTYVGTGAGLTGGPITTSGTISLTTTGVSAGTYGSTSQAPTITVDAYGRITSASNSSITPTSIGAVPTTRQVSTTGALTGGGALSSDLTLSIAPIASGDILGNSSGSSASPQGTTLSSVIDTAMGSTVGNILYRSTGGWTSLTPGTTGQVLQTQGAGSPPIWGTTTGTGTVTSVDGSGGTTGMTLSGGPITGAGTLTLGGTLGTANGGTNLTSFTSGGAMYATSTSALTTGTLPVTAGGSGATTLTGYLKGNGTSAFTASASIPNTDITGLGTMSTQNANSVSITGGTATLTSVSLTSGTITATPSNGTDIANKDYVDSVAQGLNFHQACNYATTADLGTVNYSNGTGGVGATLTNAGTQAILVIDGHTFTATDVTNAVRILVKNQSNAAYNGIYVLTNQGSISTNWSMIRATDFDSAGTGPGQIDAGDFILIISGSSNANTSWVQQTPLPITIGTTGIVFTQFGAGATYTAGTGLTLIGNQFSLTNPVATNLGGTGLASFTSGGAVYATSTSALTTGTLPIASGGTGQVTASAAFDALSPITTTGDLIIGNGTNSATRLPIGTNGYVLTSNGTTASWQASTGGVTSFQTSLSGLTPSSSTTGAVTLAGTLGEISGGTGQTSYTTGDILYASASNTLSKLTAGTNGYVLTMSSGVPVWAASTGGVTSFSAGSTGLTPNTSTTGAITLGGTLATANGGTGLTSFTSGGAVYASSSSVLTTGTLPITSGGTGQTSASAAFNALSPITSTGDLILGNGTNSATRLPIGANGYVLTSDGTTASWQAAGASGVSTISFGSTGLTPSTATSGAVTVGGTLAAASGGTGQTTYTTGDVLYASGSSAISKLGIGSTGQVLTVSGGIPSWATPATGGATGGGTDKIFWNNDQTVTTSYSIPSNTNAGTFGPVTISGSATVTIPSSSSWTVV